MVSRPRSSLLRSSLLQLAIAATRRRGIAATARKNGEETEDLELLRARSGGSHGHRGPDPGFHEGRQTRHHQGGRRWPNLLDLIRDLFGAICIAFSYSSLFSNLVFLITVFDFGFSSSFIA